MLETKARTQSQQVKGKLMNLKGVQSSNFVEMLETYARTQWHPITIERCLLHSLSQKPRMQINIVDCIVCCDKSIHFLSWASLVQRLRARSLKVLFWLGWALLVASCSVKIRTRLKALAKQ